MILQRFLYTLVQNLVISIQLPILFVNGGKENEYEDDDYETNNDKYSLTFPLILSAFNS